VVEVILEWKPCEDLVAVKVGKINLARVFDTSEYANDETSQFLNGAFINDPTIPIPDYCLGVVLSANLTDWWSVAAGVGDGEANGRTTGFRTTFDGDDYFFYALETDLRTKLSSSHGPLAGNLRFGLWYDPQPKAHSGSDEAYRNDVGAYTSVDQVLFKENDDPEDSQGLGVFARFGCTDSKRNDIATFWSAGVQYQGLWRGRDDDVLGLAFAQGLFSDEALAPFTDDYESVVEFYYSIHVAPWVTVSPDAQYITNPGGDEAVADALVVGVRAQIAF
jgi:carbohydrate-selective porin OprB